MASLRTRPHSGCGTVSSRARTGLALLGRRSELHPRKEYMSRSKVTRIGENWKQVSGRVFQNTQVPKDNKSPKEVGRSARGP